MSTRLYQPNLTCSYDITMTDDNLVWTLVMRNHEDMGITDNQFINELWNFCNVFTKRLVSDKLFKMEKEDDCGEVSTIISHDNRYKSWVIMSSGEKELTASTFIVILAETAKQLAEQANVNLKGLPPHQPEATV